MFAAMGALGLAPHTECDCDTGLRRAGPRFPPHRPLTGHSRHPRWRHRRPGTRGTRPGKPIDCTILEPRSRTGGRNFTARAGTEQTDLFGKTQAHFQRGPVQEPWRPSPACPVDGHLGLLPRERPGVPIEVFTNTNADAYIYNEYGMKPGHPMRYRTAKSDVYGYVSELLVKATSQVAPTSSSPARTNNGFAAFLENWGSIGRCVEGLRLHRQHQPWIQRVPGRVRNPRHQAGSGAQRVGGLRLGGGYVLLLRVPVDQAMPMFQPVGGTARPPRHPRNRSARVRLGCKPPRSHSPLTA